MLVLPHIFSPTGVAYNRLIVEIQKIPEKVLENGLISPERESTSCDIGVVHSCCTGSNFKPGDNILYNKIDRVSGEHFDTALIDGKVYDVIYENEVIAVNERPYNRVFVKQAKGAEVSGSGLLIAKEVKSVTQKGTVFASPPGYFTKQGDEVEYRKKEGDLYGEVELDGEVYDVLFEADIFRINGRAAPYRIIIKIDLHAQAIKRNASDSGLALSPLFIAMLRNLQIAEIIDMGDEAHKMYPELEIGDTAIIHHSIESQPYRVMGHIMGKNNLPVYEFRCINCWIEKSREIFGKIKYEKNTGKIIDIQPVNGNVFLKWELNLFEKQDDENSLLISVDNDLSKYNNLDDLRNVINLKKKEAAEKAKAKSSGIKLAMSQLDPHLHKDRLDLLDSEFKSIQKEETRIANHLRKNHLVVCKSAYPMQIPSYIITTYEELYPINILGKKFLIAHPDFILAKTHKNMDISVKDITALGDNVFVLPQEEKKETDLLLPDSAKERPSKGLVVAIHDEEEVHKGDIVLFRRGAGLEQTIDGVKHLIMKRNDLIAVV